MVFDSRSPSLEPTKVCKQAGKEPQEQNKREGRSSNVEGVEKANEESRAS